MMLPLQADYLKGMSEKKDAVLSNVNLARNPNFCSQLKAKKHQRNVLSLKKLISWNTRYKKEIKAPNVKASNIVEATNLVEHAFLNLCLSAQHKYTHQSDENLLFATTLISAFSFSNNYRRDSFGYEKHVLGGWEQTHQTLLNKLSKLNSPENTTGTATPFSYQVISGDVRHENLTGPKNWI